MAFVRPRDARNIVIDDVFRALSDPIRRSLLETLGKRQFFCAVDGESVDGICVQDLSSILQLPQSTVSRHLTILRQAGLVDHQQKGVWRYYSCNQDTISAVQLWLDSIKRSASVTEPPRLSPDDLKRVLPSVNLLDIRPASEFLSGFIPGSINLPISEENFVGNLRKVWPHPGDVVIIVEEPTIPASLVSYVEEVGGTVKGISSFKEWNDNGNSTLKLQTADIQNLLQDHTKYVLVDVRTEEEWDNKHIKGSLNLPLYRLDLIGQKQLDVNKKYVAFCAGVYRGIAGAAKLRALGFDVLYLPGGVKAWEEQGGPTEGVRS